MDKKNGSDDRKEMWRNKNIEQNSSLLVESEGRGAKVHVKTSTCRVKELQKRECFVRRTTKEKGENLG